MDTWYRMNLFLPSRHPLISQIWLLKFKEVELLLQGQTARTQQGRLELRAPLHSTTLLRKERGSPVVGPAFQALHSVILPPSLISMGKGLVVSTLRNFRKNLFCLIKCSEKDFL